LTKFKGIFKYLLILVQTAVIFSCGKNKQSQSNLLESTDEGYRFAAASFGPESEIMEKGDLNGNGHEDIFAVTVNKKLGENKFWVQKGGIVENIGGWKTILSIDSKLSSTRGILVNQIDAKYGYLISYNPKERPLNLLISIADSTGNAVSDEAMIKWNEKENTYEFISNPGVIDNNAP
jgi:hypothetical protein